MKKKIIMVMIVFELMSVMLFISDRTKTDSFDGTIQRPEAGSDPVSEALVVTKDEQEREVSVNVSSQARNEEQIQALFDGAKSEIDKTFPGENESLDSVLMDTNPKNSYQEGAVEAVWDFDNYDVIDAAGKLRLDSVTEDTPVQANCTLKCEGMQEVYSFAFIVKRPDIDTDTGFEHLLNKALKERDSDTRDEKTLVLPGQIDTKDVSWKLRENNRALQLALFGIFTGAALLVAGKEDKKRKIKERKKKMESDYPEIVSMLSLYVGAGISVKSAFTRIADSYENREHEEDRPGFEGVVMLKRDMTDGKGELDAYRDFGKRMGQKDYRKLSILLSQNLRKGSSQLIDQLEKEEHAAFEERKVRAKIAGEEASTKMLLPMIGLLGIVMAVLIFPAMQGLSF